MNYPPHLENLRRGWPRPSASRGVTSVKATMTMALGSRPWVRLVEQHSPRQLAGLELVLRGAGNLTILGKRRQPTRHQDLHL